MATRDEVLRQLAALEDPRMRAVNERHGDDHGVNLSKLRALAKATGMHRALAGELWAADDTAAQLVAVLISRPKDWTIDELDAMLRTARSPKVVDWLTNYLAKKSPDAQALRGSWFASDEPEIAAAGWALTADAVKKTPELLDLPALLDRIEADMQAAPTALQWEMNNTLAAIGITHPELRERAIDIGERLGVLRDYPTPPNCTSPFAPVWIREIVGRQG